MRKRRFHIMYLSAAPFFVSFFFLMLLISGSAVRAGIGMEAGSESTQLTLRDALIIALENNLDIKVERRIRSGDQSLYASV
jgi:hypothetical protein